MAFLLGIDVGSSSIKVTLLDSQTGKVAATATSPQTELQIVAPQPGWAEQDPAVWWENTKQAIRQIQLTMQSSTLDIDAIGISYQMHGLVALDEKGAVLRPSIIWCDSRAVTYGDKAFTDLGSDYCLGSCLNSPGNFTASKLKE